MTADRVGLIDWDEAHVDVPDLDLVLPHTAAGLAEEAHDLAAQASAAWDAAVCWDDEHAVTRLAEEGRPGFLISTAMDMLNCPGVGHATCSRPARPQTPPSFWEQCGRMVARTLLVSAHSGTTATCIS